MKKPLSIVALAILLTTGFCMIPKIADADSFEVEQTWVRMRGQVAQWGSTPMEGRVVAHARTVDTNETYREWARVHIFWSTELPHFNSTEPPTGNFSYSFYAARLVNSSMIMLNYSGNDFYILGSWNVYNVTITFYVDESGELLSYSFTIEALIVDGEGELCVFDDWRNFQVSINGIDMLSGNVLVHAISNMEISICDINGNGAVNLADLVGVAKRYGSMPGRGNYNMEMDFNFDFVIDIGDLTTIAANLGEE